MPAPTNTSFATAINIGATLPYTTTQRVDFSGTTYTVWYAYPAQVGDTEISVLAFGDLVTYTPQVTFWTDASTQFLNNNAINRPSQIPVTPGTTYGIKISPNGGNPTPANLTLTIKRGPQTQLATGQIAINDSGNGYPVVIMNAATAAPVAFKHPFASGESVMVLKSGMTCAADITNDRVLIYDQNLDLRVTPTMPAAGYHSCVGTNQLNSFWIGKAGGGAVHAFMVLMQTTGTFGTPIDLGSAGLKSLAPNAANSLVYFIKDDSSNNQPVFVVNTNTLAITTFLAGVANYSFHTVNVMTMTDDTVLVHYAKSGSASYIEQRNPNGTLAKTFTLAVDAGVQHIFADPDDPNYFWIWTEGTDTNSFTRIKVSDGSTTTAGPWPQFVEGDYQPVASATPTAYFGADFSCDPWIVRGISATTTSPIRRQRRFLLPSSDDNKRMQMPTLELLMRTGIGLTAGPAGSPVQGQDPQVMLRISKDGGETWGYERWVSAGALGEFKDRVRWLRATGNYRNAVGEITVTDPVDWQFLAMLGDPIEGSS